MQFLPYRKQTAAWRPRHFLAIKIGEFSQENSRVKIAWMQFLPAFQGSAIAPFAIAPFASANGYAALPIGASLNLLPKKTKILPWLDTVWQERITFPELVEGNLPKKNHLSKKGFLGVKPLSRAGKGRGLRGGKTLASE